MFLKSMTLLSLMSAMASAQMEPSRMYPYLSPQKCKYSVQSPAETSGGYFRNEDCSVVLVKPPVEGQMNIEGFAYTHGILDLCEAYRLDMESSKDLKTIASNARKRAKSLNPQNPEVQNLLATAERCEKQIESAKKRWSRYLAAKIGLSVSNGLTADYIQAWEAENIPAIRDHQAIFEPVPIKAGYLTFEKADAENPDIEAPMILASSFPAIESESGSRIYKMGHSLRGNASLSLAAACPLITGNEQNIREGKHVVIDEKSANALIAVNYTYSVPLMTAVQYQASLDVKNSFTAITKQFGTKTQFTTNKLREMNLTGEGSSRFEFKLEKGENPEDLVDENWTSSLRDHVSGELHARLAEFMYSKGLIEFVPVNEVIPDGGTVNEPFSERRCAREMGPFGLWVGNEHCWNEIVFRPVWKDGKLTAEDFNIENTNIHISEFVQLRGVIYRVETMQFRIAQQAR